MPAHTNSIVYVSTRKTEPDRIHYGAHNRVSV